MENIRLLEQVKLEASWLTIGSFDGVHIGHKKLIRSLVEGAHKRGRPAVVLTFEPHPVVVLRKGIAHYLLSTPEEKAQQMASLGVDYLITHPFNKQVAAMSALQFMQLLSDQLGLRYLFVGYNFALGHNREGDLYHLRGLGRKLGYTVRVFSPVRLSGEVVSSSGIRDLLTSGEVKKASEWLGRRYKLSGVVVRGDDRGKKLGIPTANLDIRADLVQPRAGVYACWAIINGDRWGAVSNVGVRPTFEFQPVAPRVEAHLFDFEGDLYGQVISLEFLSRLREEKRFPNENALVDQIRGDIENARGMLSMSRE
ncbi:MAG: bifunctional riboflavin kinase/FAD synthetase [Chloroflexota bacterium]